MHDTDSHPGHARHKSITLRCDKKSAVFLTAAVAVLAVAAVAGWVSYRHAVAVVSAHGEPGIVGRWYPVTIDGLIIAASMVLLDAASHEEDAAPLAWWLLGAGIGATLAVNVLAGLPSGWFAAIVAGWPAAAFVGCYELLMMLVRANARRGVSPGTPAGDLNQDEPGEPPTTEAVLLDLVNRGTRQAVADLLGVPKTRVQRWAKELPAVVHGGPETGTSDGGRDGDAALPVPAASAGMNGHG